MFKFFTTRINTSYSIQYCLVLSLSFIPSLFNLLPPLLRKEKDKKKREVGTNPGGSLYLEWIMASVSSNFNRRVDM